MIESRVLAETTVKLGERVSPVEAPCVYYYEMAGACTYACAACMDSVTTAINEDFPKRNDFFLKHAACSIPLEDDR